MNITKTYTVKPNLPKELKPLEEIARNLWLSWNFDAVQLFIRLDQDSWVASRQNPIKTLGMVSQERISQCAKDNSYISDLNRVYERFDSYKGSKDTWWEESKYLTKDEVAYFSMEYGMDVSLPVYSGGLGILSGDHMKSSSDLGLPLVGVGLLYRQGYFVQHINREGMQYESYPENDWYNMPVEQKFDKEGKALTIEVELEKDRKAVAQIWEVKVGRNSLYLLDTNIPENDPDIRNITAALYGGDKETRIRQEILLGIGGIRALRKLGVPLAVTHMNEGHSAFLVFERIREFMEEKGLSFDEAREAVWPTNMFTTHTPVPAGNERFDIPLMEKYFKHWADKLQISWKDFLALGRINPNDDNETYCLTVLALKMAAYANGVARLHGTVSRKMWQGLWPDLPVSEVPIGYVTNGVHPRTWLSNDMKYLLDRYLGRDFEEKPHKLKIWDRIDDVSDAELWSVHERRRERLVAFARERIRRQLENNGESPRAIKLATDALLPNALTLCFARRFATYKRGALLLSNPERLKKLLGDKKRPVQLIFAGKAHPHDKPGKEIIQQIVRFAQDNGLSNRIVFIENYDMTVAKYLVSGGDVWLNTPRRPLEASGTSGMKAAMNGVLNCSILDGWWDEAFDRKIGWAIGHREEYSSDKEAQEYQDTTDCAALYELLEREIIPLFFDRVNEGLDELPHGWIEKMKASMMYVGKSMSCHRMIMDYSEKFYSLALKNHKSMTKGNFEEARAVASYMKKIEQNWSHVKITRVESNVGQFMHRGDPLIVKAFVELGGLKPEDVRVELYHGAVSNREIVLRDDPEESCKDPWDQKHCSTNIDAADRNRAPMKAVRNDGLACEFEGSIKCLETGMQGYAVRVLPNHKDLKHSYRQGFIKWSAV